MTEQNHSITDKVHSLVHLLSATKIDKDGTHQPIVSIENKDAAEKKLMELIGKY